MSNFQQVMNLPFPTSEEYAIDANANNEITEEIIKGYIDPDFLDYTKSYFTHETLRIFTVNIPCLKLPVSSPHFDTVFFNQFC